MGATVTTSKTHGARMWLSVGAAAAFGLATLVSPAGPAAAAATATWQAPQDLIPDAVQRTPVVSSSADGSVIAVMAPVSASGNQLEILTISHDGGATWDDTIISTPSCAAKVNSASRGVAVSDDGQTITAMWIETCANDNLMVAVSQSGGSSWDDTIVTTNSSYVANAKLSTASDGNAAAVIWQEPGNTLDSIRVSSSDDTGLSWDDSTTLVDDTTVRGGINISMSGDGAAIGAVWIADDRALRVATTANAWQSVTTNPLPYAGDLREALEPVLVSSTNGSRMTVSWVARDRTTGDYAPYSSTTANGGTSWTSAPITPPADDEIEGLRIAASDLGSTLTAVWHDVDTGEVRTSTSMNFTATWGAFRSLGQFGGVAGSFPSVATSADGSTSTIAWEYVDIESVTTTDSGASWSSPQTLSIVGTAGYPAVAASADGESVGVAWTDYSAGTMTQFARGTVTAPAPLPPAPAFPPSAPLNVVGAAGPASALVSWAEPMSSGSFPISNYRVVASPSGSSCLTSTLSCTVTGLSDGTAYTFTVLALNGAGWGPASAASNPVVPGGANPAPAPEPLPAPVPPGDHLLQVNGVVDPNVAVQPNATMNGLLVDGDNWTMELDGLGPDGKPLNLGPNDSLRLAIENEVVTEGTGFLPNSDVDLYVNPPVQAQGTAAGTQVAEALYVGTVKTNAQGAFSGTATLPRDLPAGEHVLQAVGYSPTLKARAMSLGVTVDAWIVLNQGTRRATSRHDRITTSGSTEGIPAGARLTPYIRYAGQETFQKGQATINVAADGTFRWTRLIKATKGITAYVAYQDLVSNRVFWAKVR